MKTVLKRIWAGWKVVAHKIGIFQTKLLLTILYFIIIAVASFFVVILRRDLLDKKIGRGGSLYHSRDRLTNDLEHAKRQF